MGSTGRVWRIHSWSVIVANSLWRCSWRYSVYHQALQRHIYCFALLVSSLPVQCLGLMTEQGWCSSNHLVTQMVRLLTTHLWSSLIITSSAQGPRYQNMCLTLHSSRDTSRWRYRMQVLWRLWELLGLKWQTSQVIWEVSPSNCVQQYSKGTTAYPSCAGLRWEPKDGTVWFVKVSSETENRQKIHQEKMRRFSVRLNRKYSITVFEAVCTRLTFLMQSWHCLRWLYYDNLALTKTTKHVINLS